MPLKSYLRLVRDGFFRPRRTQKRAELLRLEVLEDRSVPSIIFNNASTATVSDGGGPVIDQVHVELIFWGSGWDSGQGPALRSQVQDAVDSITGGPYLSSLSQYRASIGSGYRADSVSITSSDPSSVFTNTDVQNLLSTNIANQTLPAPASDPGLLYMVIPQPGTSATFNGTRVGGAHSYFVSGEARAHFGFTINPGDLDHLTYYFSHELAEAVSDPEGTAIQVNPRSPSFWNEIADNEAQNYSYRLNGYVVNSLFSQLDHGFVVPTGQSQNFYLSSSRALTVNGDQLPDPTDAITVDQEGGGYQVTLNGEVAHFDARDLYTGQLAVSSITINGGTGDDTVNIERTVAGLLSGLPVTVNLGDGTDTVNLSPSAQNLKNFPGAVTINGGSGSATLALFDQGVDTNVNYTLTSSTVVRPGMATVVYRDLAGLTLHTTNGTDTITVQSTPANTAVTVVGGSGTNTLVGSAVDNLWGITGSNSGTLASANIAGLVSFSSVQNLTGGAATNTFVFSDGAGISGNLAGGGGTLDYSAYSTSIVVNLQTSTATGVGGTVANIQNVIGGTGGGAGVYNILVGNGGNTLTAGSGRRNLLVAGSSASTLIGGDDDDILIGGTTAYDTEVASLTAIMEYWSGTPDDYGTRVGNLIAGNGVPLLDPTTVTGNGGGNTLTGGSGLNLYYGNDLDTTDFDPNAGAIYIPV